MIQKYAVMGVATFALFAAAVVGSSQAMAQTSSACSGTASYVNGEYVVQNATPSDEPSGQCEILVMPGGGLAMQNGGDMRVNNGVDAPHESQGHAP